MIYQRLLYSFIPIVFFSSSNKFHVAGKKVTISKELDSETANILKALIPDILQPKINSEIIKPKPVWGCKKSDIDICSEFCTKVKHFETGICERKENVCICKGKNGISKRVMIRTAEGERENEGTILRPNTVNKFEIKGNVREKRTLSDFGEIEETIIEPLEVMGRSRLGMGRRRPFRPHRPGRLPSGPLGICTAFSCTQNCPPRCDSLCATNLQCFCSCPEDEAFYEYYDGPFFTDSLAYY